MRRVGRIALWVVVLAVLGAGVRLVIQESRTNSRIREAAEALERDDATGALKLLELPLIERKDSGEVQFLAARANRLAGDIPAARKHLAAAKALLWPPEAIDLETGLLQAQTDSLAVEYDYHLRKCLQDNHPDSKYIAQVLAGHDFAKFRLMDADRAARIWTEKAPNSAKAWAFRGDICERTRKRAEGVAAYRKAAELDPANISYRLALSRHLLNSKAPPDEAAVILETLHDGAPENIAILLQLAYCRTEQARHDEAVPLVDRVLKAEPNSMQALHLKGRIELARGHPELAVPPLRRAVELGPFETDLLFSLLQALNQNGPADEAAKIKERWSKCAADLEKLGETTRGIASNPDDPDLRKTAGEICLRNGLEKEGIQWLQSALRARADHTPTHLLMAEHYEKTGKVDLAAAHRERAKKSTPPK